VWGTIYLKKEVWNTEVALGWRFIFQEYIELQRWSLQFGFSFSKTYVLDLGVSFG
jgi:hypothetical protein